MEPVGETSTLALRTSEAVIIIDEEAVPSEYLIIKQVVTVDKREISRAFKAGESVAGADIEYGSHLRRT